MHEIMFCIRIAELKQVQLASFDYLSAFKAQIKKQTPLFENYYKRTKKSQLEFLNSYLEFFAETNAKLASNQFIDSYFVKTLHYLYNELDFLSDEAILEWHDKQIANLATFDKTKKYAIGKLKPFIEWIKEDDEDDD